MPMSIDATASPELRATILAVKSVDKTLRKMVRDYTRKIAEPEWREALADSANTRLERAVIVDTAVVRVSDRNVRIQSARKGRPLTGGLNPKVDYPAVEFGANIKTDTYTRRSPRGKAHKVTRKINTGLPRRRAKGPFYVAAGDMVPRMAALWIATTVKTIGNALEGKQE